MLEKRYLDTIAGLVLGYALQSMIGNLRRACAIHLGLTAYSERRSSRDHSLIKYAKDRE